MLLPLFAIAKLLVEPDEAMTGRGTSGFNSVRTYKCFSNFPEGVRNSMS